MEREILETGIQGSGNGDDGRGIIKKSTRRSLRDPLRKLSEAIILQSMEDLWNHGKRRESVRFFAGEEFELCSKMAKLSCARQMKLLYLLSRAGARGQRQRLSAAI